MFKKTLLSLMLVSGAASANLIVNGDFESSLSFPHGSWGVFDSIDGWQTTAGAGIEVERNTVVRAYSGNQYVELDSHNNSTMTQLIQTQPGQDYLLSFFYRPRTNNGAQNDNGMAVYWDSVAGTSLTGFSAVTQVFSIDNASRSAQNFWQEYQVSLRATGTTMALSFAGTGKNNSLGAFVDNLSLTAVPEPGALAMLGVGLIGLGIRRGRGSKQN